MISCPSRPSPLLSEGGEQWDIFFFSVERGGRKRVGEMCELATNKSREEVQGLCVVLPAVETCLRRSDFVISGGSTSQLYLELKVRS